MAKCRLGEKKRKKIEELTGKKVEAAFVRGGWKHFWAEVFFKDETYTVESPPPMVNYKTGEIECEGSPEMDIMKKIVSTKMEEQQCSGT